MLRKANNDLITLLTPVLEFAFCWGLGSFHRTKVRINILARGVNCKKGETNRMLMAGNKRNCYRKKQITPLLLHLYLAGFLFTSVKYRKGYWENAI